MGSNLMYQRVMLVLTSFIGMCIPFGTMAGNVILPETKHQAYQSFGLFEDNQTSLLLRDSQRAWGAVGGAIALYGGEQVDDGQFVVTASVNASFRFVSGVLFAETMDARATLSWDTTISSHWLFSGGFTHASGHAMDDIQDLDLLPLNVGIESFPFRFVYTGSSLVRPGFTFQPLFGAEPTIKAFLANEFIEIFPFGTASDVHHPTPYIALGAEQLGHNKLDFSGHVQLGVYFGNHLERKRVSSTRVVLGAYAGPDPRLKYYLYKDRYVHFAYFGFMVDF